MRVGVIGPTGPDRFADNVADALGRMGHEVTKLGPAHPNHETWRAHHLAMVVRMSIPFWDEQSQQRLSRAALEAECEVVISVDLRVTPSTIAAIKSDGARVAFWFPDAVSQLGRQLMFLAPYDALFFKEPHVVDRVRAMLGLSVYYLPEACNPRWHNPEVPAGSDPYIVVPANTYAYRVRLLERLSSRGIPLRIYGAGFPHWLGETPLRRLHVGRVVVREEKSRVYRSAAGVLNSMHPAEIAGVNGRLFQAAGCGAAVLAEYRPTLPDLFRIDHEVLAFRDFDELADGATRLLNDDGLTAKIGDAAAKRAHSEHSYERRLIDILEQIS